LDQKHGEKMNNEIIPGTDACQFGVCCNPDGGKVDFEAGWLIKSSFIKKNEHKACQLEIPTATTKFITVRQTINSNFYH
jgi:hypothetical protein